MRIESIPTNLSIQSQHLPQGRENSIDLSAPNKTAELKAAAPRTGQPEITEEIIRAIEKANQKFEVYNTRVEFSIHEQTHQIMIKVLKNDQIIREIPSEKILDMVAKMMEMAGILVDEKA